MSSLKLRYQRLYYHKLYHHLHPSDRFRMLRRFELFVLGFEYVHFSVYLLWPEYHPTLVQYDPMLYSLIYIYKAKYVYMFTIWAFLNFSLSIIYILASTKADCIVWRVLDQLVIGLTDAYLATRLRKPAKGRPKWIDDNLNRRLQYLDQFMPNLCGYNRLITMCTLRRHRQRNPNYILGILHPADRFWMMLLINAVELMLFIALVCFLVIGTCWWLVMLICIHLHFPLYLIPLTIIYLSIFLIFALSSAVDIIFMLLNLFLFEVYLILQFNRIQYIFTYLLRGLRYRKRILRFCHRYCSISANIFSRQVIADHVRNVYLLLRADRQLFSKLFFFAFLTNFPNSMILVNLSLFGRLPTQILLPLVLVIIVQLTFLVAILSLAGHVSKKVHQCSKLFPTYQQYTLRPFMDHKFKLMSMFEYVHSNKHLGFSIGTIVTAITKEVAFECILVYLIYVTLVGKLVT